MRAQRISDSIAFWQRLQIVRNYHKPPGYLVPEHLLYRFSHVGGCLPGPDDQNPAKTIQTIGQVVCSQDMAIKPKMSPNGVSSIRSVESFVHRIQYGPMLSVRML